ncbi:alpha-ketoglutarate-dependent taurine dioxygenase [Venturia nashicola]|uniref:Alpha-ketoglutarate-dependent taurine dioxygenase n=1 Tax=Venturia nashicola TaxID=86259 RepID=A0A4Z1NUE2_9PEZI|nr:alpha-ketoglutarate-dependent taurine dioxygenase [Venturia nashicola]
MLACSSFGTSDIVGTSAFVSTKSNSSRIENIADRMWKRPRGSPKNVSASLRASHPAARTNPVTGWKSFFDALVHHLEAIESLGDLENHMILELLERLLVDNH